MNKKLVSLIAVAVLMGAGISQSSATLPTPKRLCTTYQIDVWKWDHSVISNPDGSYTPNPITMQNKAVLTCLASIQDDRAYGVQLSSLFCFWIDPTINYPR